MIRLSRVLPCGLLFVAWSICGIWPASAAAPRVLEPGKRPADSRLGAPRTLSDPYHPWVPPATMAEWEAARKAIRERMLVGMGLWPMPPVLPLQPVIHGKIEREDYTVEKVFFASHPSHYVSGNLYRPKKIDGKVPGVLSPHGHWQNGRFYELPADKAQSEQIDKGAETYLSGARYPLQARMVGLARMGCVVFHYDMVGTADSAQKFQHTKGFTDVDSALRLHDFMGLQTFNSMRALDFLLSLPEVDPDRIGVTGASGGGTQTFALCALDPRPTVAFPAVMVSTAMQGGCICENCSYLRIGLNNIAFTAAFAPRPLAMSGADDWTINIENKGLPELKLIYGLYDKADFVNAKTFAQFPHNYNQVAREMMYAWFNKHLGLGLSEPIRERDFQPVPPAELSVYDASHPVPADALDAAGLKDYFTKTADEQYHALLPKDASGLEEYRRVVGTAARIMLDGDEPAGENVRAASPMQQSTLAGCRLYRVSASRRDANEQVPVIALIPPTFKNEVVIWIDGAGKDRLFDAEGNPIAAVKTLLDAGRAVISADVFQTGEFLENPAQPLTEQKVNEGFVGYTFGYNRPLVANRVRDILTVVAGVRKFPMFQKINLVGTGEAGPWVMLARGLCKGEIGRCIASLDGFAFSKITNTNDPMMLPGALKYGGIGGLAALAVPGPLELGGAEMPQQEFAGLAAVNKAAHGYLVLYSGPLSDEKIAKRLLAE
jgi:dienelactone hydrolase